MTIVEECNFKKILSDIKFRQAHNYMLFNCDELRHFVQYVSLTIL
jgi:hypothetical protein